LKLYPFLRLDILSAVVDGEIARTGQVFAVDRKGNHDKTQRDSLKMSPEFCMAFYNVLSRSFIQRSSALGFLTIGMGAGAAALILAGSLTGSFAVLGSLSTPQWIAGIYLGVGGGALAFILWVMALERATPTRVASTMTVNPLAAGLLATLLVGEPITPNLVLGLVAVFVGIWIGTAEIRKV
jgi:drug/metabolite transporter (DMT)-like permease